MPTSEQRLADQVQHLLGVGGVEGAGGLIGEDELGAIGQSAGDGDALLLADGEFLGADSSGGRLRPTSSRRCSAQFRSWARPVKVMPSRTFSRAVNPGRRWWVWKM